jgi:hypothetical protein
MCLKAGDGAMTSGEAAEAALGGTIPNLPGAVFVIVGGDSLGKPSPPLHNQPFTVIDSNA